jgi:hypothetical protein
MTDLERAAIKAIQDIDKWSINKLIDRIEKNMNNPLTKQFIKLFKFNK